MLGKLFKYELKAASRTFLPIYMALIVLSIANRIFQGVNIIFVTRLGAIIEGALFIALWVVTLFLIIQRFNKNLLKDEGYLMFTLPVKPRTLIISKLLSAVVWSIGSGIAALLAIMILVFTGEDIIAVFEAIPEFFRALFTTKGVMTGCIEIFLLCVFSYMEFILSIYLSLSLSQLPKLIKHRGKVSFVMFIIINVIISILFGYSVEALGLLQINESVAVGAITAEFALIAIILFTATNYILSKHLNLE